MNVCMHVYSSLLQMFWTALSDSPKSAVVRFLQSLWGSNSSYGSSDERNAERVTGIGTSPTYDLSEKERGLPEEIFYWKNSSSSLGSIVIADLPAGLKGSSSVDCQVIHIAAEERQRIMYVPRYSSLEVMRVKLKLFINSM